MRTEYVISLDTHCRTTDACVKTMRGKLVRREHLSTGIPQLRQFIESIASPRSLVFEEGPMAGWLHRNLRDSVKDLVVCDPARNAHIAKDGDKDDPIDAEKLNDLHRGGYTRAVHQAQSVEQAAFKQLVGAYHQRVAHRVQESNRVIGFAKRWGVMLTRSQLISESADTWCRRLSEAHAPASAQSILRVHAQSHEQACIQEQTIRELLLEKIKSDELIGRLQAMCGYGPIRAATFVAYIDTPWRFKSKSALWKYVGIGLCRERSGDGRAIIKVEQACNHLLRNIVIGAAQSAIKQKDNAFAERYRQWVASGLSLRNARRNVARMQTGIAWGMWKNGQVLDAQWCGDGE